LLNVGIAAAQNEWIAFTDDDCLPDSDWLCAADAFATSGLARVFGGRVIPTLDEEGLPVWLYPGRRGRAPEHGAVVQYDVDGGTGVVPRYARKPIGANFFCRKDVFREHGGYDEELWDRCGKAAIGSDDGGLMIRLDRAGEPVGYCAESLVRHPVYLERATFLYHWQSAFWLGYRDALVTGERPLTRWTLRQLTEQGARALYCWSTGDCAAAMHHVGKVAVSYGKLLCRLRRYAPL